MVTRPTAGPESKRVQKTSAPPQLYPGHFAPSRWRGGEHKARRCEGQGNIYELRKSRTNFPNSKHPSAEILMHPFRGTILAHQVSREMKVDDRAQASSFPPSLPYFFSFLVIELSLFYLSAHLLLEVRPTGGRVKMSLLL